jgi:hypothetical protein
MRRSEAVATVMQLIIAGSDSSASLMGSMVRLLAQNPDVQEELRAHPELVPNFVEESIRLESPFQGHFRQTKVPVELHGEELPINSRVMLLWASGNRDPRKWPDPDKIDLHRAGLRQHLSFGHGIHLCLGAPIGRMEGRIALEQLLERTDWVELGEGDFPHRKSVFVRTLERLPIKVHRKKKAIVHDLRRGLGVGPRNRYLEAMRFISFVFGCTAFAVLGCNSGGQSAGQPTVGSAQASLISYHEAMQRPVAIGDATKKCREKQLSSDEVVAELDGHLDQMYRKCVVSEARRGAVPGTVTIDIAILGDGSVQGATVSPGSKRLQSCIGDIVESIRFPKFAAPRMGARYQFHTS